MLHRGRADADHPIAVLALLALVEGRVVALVTAEALDHRTCEVAFLVSDDLQGHGVGTLLLQHLAAAARSGGITRFTAEVLSDNAAMLRVFRSAEFDSTRESTAGVTRVRMSTEASGRVVADVHEHCSGGHR